MLNNKEKKLLHRLYSLNTSELFNEVDSITKNCSDELLESIVQLTSQRLSEECADATPFEEALQDWFDKMSSEDQSAFLTEDWSDYDSI